MTFVCSAIVIKDYANKAWPDIDLSLALVNKVKQFIDLYYQSVNLMFLLSMLSNVECLPKAYSHASSASNVHAFSTLYDGRNEKGLTCEGLSSERPKNKQDKVLKDKKVIDKMNKGQNKKFKKLRRQKAYRTIW